MTSEELELMMQKYEQNRGVPSYEPTRGGPSRSMSMASGNEMERRTPIRPRQSMKGILYNGVGTNEVVKGVAIVQFDICKRANDDGYHYGQH